MIQFTMKYFEMRWAVEWSNYIYIILTMNYACGKMLFRTMNSDATSMLQWPIVAVGNSGHTNPFLNDLLTYMLDNKVWWLVLKTGTNSQKENGSHQHSRISEPNLPQVFSFPLREQGPICVHKKYGMPEHNSDFLESYIPNSFFWGGHRNFYSRAVLIFYISSSSLKFHNPVFR